MNCREAIFGENTREFFVQRYRPLEELQSRYGFDCIKPLNSDYAVAYLQSSRLANFGMGFANVYSAVPKCYALTNGGAENASGAGERDSGPALEAIGVAQLRRLPYLDLYGGGVLIGFVDTGIDYKHPVFRRPDGTSRIRAIWDQTVQDGTPPDGFDYGQEYTQEDITRALASENPAALVPETDDNGHGTFVAGTAAGNLVREDSFSGVAPQAEIVMVKLKQAKQYLRDIYFIPPEADCYQETDLAFGVEYLVRTAEAANRPLIICMTLGTNSGGHDGAGILDEILDGYAGRYNSCIIVSTGSEAGYGLHYHSFGVEGEYEEVELRIGERERGFTMELWATSLNQYSVSVISPTGELINREMNRRNHSQIMNFLFEDTRIYLDYFMAETRTGNQLIIMRMQQPTPGIWRFLVYRDQDFGGDFDIWLPVHAFVQEDTYFLRPNPDITITDPGNTRRLITASSYRISDRSIYQYSGRGFTRNGVIKPDISAPGVAVYGPRTGGGYFLSDGGAGAAALTAGGCALILEWAIVKGRQPDIRTQEIKRLLRGGAERAGVVLPSREWGFGRVNFYGVFEELRTVVNS